MSFFPVFKYSRVSNVNECKVGIQYQGEDLLK